MISASLRVWYWEHMHEACCARVCVFMRVCVCVCLCMFFIMWYGGFARWCYSAGWIALSCLMLLAVVCVSVRASNCVYVYVHMPSAVYIHMCKHARLCILACVRVVVICSLWCACTSQIWQIFFQSFRKLWNVEQRQFSQAHKQVWLSCLHTNTLAHTNTNTHTAKTLRSLFQRCSAPQMSFASLRQWTPMRFFLSSSVSRSLSLSFCVTLTLSLHIAWALPQT